MIIASARDKVLKDMLKYLLSNVCSLYLCTNAIVSDWTLYNVGSWQKAVK